MAIIIVTTPAANVAAFSPVTIAGTTDRNPFTADVRLSVTLAASGGIAANGAYMKLTMADTTGFAVNDTVIVDGATGDFAQYNGRHKITSFSSTIIMTTATVWVAATTGTFGSVDRMNENLYVKCVVLNDSAETIATLYNFVNTSTGGWTFDISKPLQYELESIFSIATTGEKATTGMAHDYDIKLYEIWQAADYSVTEVLHGTEPSTIAHRCTELTEYLTTNNFAYDDKIFVSFYADDVEDYIIVFTTSEAVTYNAGVLTRTNGHYAIVYEPASIAKWVQIALYKVIGGFPTALGDIIYTYKIGCESTILYYSNRFGGYEGYEFHAWENDQKTIKVDKYTGEAWEERILQGKEYVKETNQNIRDLITSPDVLDEDLAVVRVLTDSLNYRASEVKPTITIRYDETFLQ